MQLDVSPIRRLVEAALGDTSPAVILTQLAAAGVALLMAWASARLVCRRVTPGPSWKFGAGDFERVAFPVLTYVFLILARQLLQRYQAVALLEIIQSLVVAWIVIRIAVYILGLVLAEGSFLRGSTRTIAWLAWIAVALHITGLLPGVIEALDDVGFTLGKDRVTLWNLIQGVAALAIMLAAGAWISRVTQTRVMAAPHLDLSTKIVMGKVVHAVTLFLAILIALPMVGIPVTALSVFSGALGVGLGFGLQKIASNYVSGFIVLLDKSLRIGDIVTVDNRKGEVRAIESRYTVIRGGDGVEAIVPNEKLITETVNHHTFSDTQSSLSLTITVSFDADFDRALGLLLDAARRHGHILGDPAAVARIRTLRDHGIELELVAWMHLRDMPDADLKSELYKDILQAFRKAGIAIAYPRSEVRQIATPEMVDSPAKSKA
jgi:small-conductance mechanosensitive channel